MEFFSKNYNLGDGNRDVMRIVSQCDHVEESRCLDIGRGKGKFLKSCKVGSAKTLCIMLTLFCL